jgi:hypothetical protein
MEHTLAGTDFDDDSNFGDTLSETVSITSDILAHCIENGRRYHACMFRSRSCRMPEALTLEQKPNLFPFAETLRL